MRVIYNFCGLACLGLAFIGIFLPLLPTTPFVILAAFCFSKGSARLHRWLLRQSVFGPMLVDWQTHHVIRFKVKCLVTTMIVVMIVVMIGYPVLFGPLGLLLRIMMVVVAGSVLSYIWSFPSGVRPLESGDRPLEADDRPLESSRGVSRAAAD